MPPERAAPLSAPVLAPVRARSRGRRAFELAFFVFAIGLLGFLVQRLGVSVVESALIGLGPLGVATILALGFSENVFDAAALRASARGELGLFQALKANSAGAIVNVLVPWNLGEVVKGTLLGAGLTARDRVSGVVIWNYVFALTRPVVSMGAALSGGLLATGFDRTLVAVVIGANVVAFFPYFVFKLAFAAGPAEKVIQLLDRFRLLRGRGQALVEAAKQLDRSVKTYAAEYPREYRSVVLNQILARVSSLGALFATTHFLGLGYTFEQVLFIYGGLNVAEYVLTAFPTRLGVTEGAAYGLFKLYGLHPPSGLLVYLVVRLKSLITNGLVAPFALR